MAARGFVPAPAKITTMRIAIASDDGQTVACHTGRYPYLIIYEIAGRQVRRVDLRPNPAAAPASATNGEARISPLSYNYPTPDAPTSAIADCQALVTGAFGARLPFDLRDRTIAVYVCATTSPEQAAQDFAAGRLAPVSLADARGDHSVTC